MPWTLAETWKDHAESLKIELASVVQRTAQFEPVRLLTSPNQMSDARARFGGGNVEIVEAPVDDIWMRDIAPTFACRGSEVLAIDWNFNGWGSAKDRPARPGDRLGGTGNAIFGVPRISVPFIAEGGALITDGEGDRELLVEQEPQSVRFPGAEKGGDRKWIGDARHPASDLA